MGRANQETIVAMQKNAHELASIDIESTIHRETLGAQTFEDVRTEIESLVRVGQEVQHADWTWVSESIAQTLNGVLNEARAVLAQAGSIGKTENPQFIQTKRQLAERIRAAFDKVAAGVIPHLGYATSRSSFAVERTQAKSAAAETVLARDQAKELLRDLSSALDAAREAGVLKAAADYEKTFSDAAKSHRSRAQRWLISAIASAAVTVVLALSFAGVFQSAWVLVSGKDDIETPPSARVATSLSPEVSNSFTSATEVAHDFLIRIGVLGLFYFVTVWCGRNYRIHSHIAEVNEHRRRALGAFSKFHEVAKSLDSSAKSAILLEVTHCIFSQSQTGFLGKDEEAPSPLFVELFQNTLRGNGGAA